MTNPLQIFEIASIGFSYSTESAWPLNKPTASPRPDEARVFTKNVSFANAPLFKASVVVGLKGFQIANTGDSRVEARAVNITTTGFDLELRAGGTAVVDAITVTYIVYSTPDSSSTQTVSQLQIFEIADFGANDTQRDDPPAWTPWTLSNSNAPSPASFRTVSRKVAFRRGPISNPAVVVALREFQIANTGDSRLEARIVDLNTAGFTLELIAWGSTVVNSASVVYIAFNAADSPSLPQTATQLQIFEMVNGDPQPAGASWILNDPNQPGGADNVRIVTKPFSFSMGKMPPCSKVQAAIREFQIQNSGDSRLEVKAANVTNTGFDLQLRAWGNAVVNSITASYIAFSEPNCSRVLVDGTKLLVQRRNLDGTFVDQSPTPYIIRGVNWAPASPNTTSDDTTRRAEFFNWYQHDIPMLATMNVNTIRVYLDFGLDNSKVKQILDTLSNSGIMVIMTVDSGRNDTDRIRQVIPLYKDHPAILMWVIGNEWNYNAYYTVANPTAADICQAAKRTEAAAQLIKALDTCHPVATCYGDIGDSVKYAPALARTRRYVIDICPTVDIWGLNIYRGNGFYTLFTDWKNITTKPMFLAEYGVDAFCSILPPPASPPVPPPACPDGSVDEQTQADWDELLWRQILKDALDVSNAGIGGCVYEWNDEFWKAQPTDKSAPFQQLTCGEPLDSQPDKFLNEQYFGIVDINRVPRQAYARLQVAFGPSFQP